MKRRLFKPVLKTLCLGMVACIPPAAQAQAPTISWDKTYGAKEGDVLTYFSPTSDKGYIAGGYSSSPKGGEKSESTRGGNDYWIVKLNEEGKIMWEKTYGGSGDDKLASVMEVKGKSPGYIVGGTSASPKSGDKDTDTKDNGDYWILYLNEKGDIEWQKTYGGKELDDMAIVIPTGDGGFLAGGTSASPKSGNKSEDSKGKDSRSGLGSDYWVIKMNSKGDIEWDRTIGGVDVCRLTDIIESKDGFLLAGYSNSKKGNDKAEDTRGQYDYWLVNIDGKRGDVIWDKTIGGDASDQLYSITDGIKGGYVMIGTSSSSPSGDKKSKPVKGSDYWVVKIDEGGKYQWDYVFGSNGEDHAKSIVKTDDNFYLLGGYSDGEMSGNKTEDPRGKNTGDYWLLKIDEKGKAAWDMTVGGSSSELGSFFYPTTDAGYIAAGYSSSDKSAEKSDGTRGGFDYWVVKFSGCVPTKSTVNSGFCKGGRFTLPDGVVVSAPNTYTSLVRGKTGCMDTVITILTENPVYNTVINAFVCTGSDYTLPDGRIVSNPGFFRCAFKTTQGCDSVITVSLTVGDADTIRSNDVICAGGSYTLPGGRTVNAAGVYYDPFVSSAKCDSVLEITLTEMVVDTGVSVFGAELSANSVSGTFQWIDCATGSAISGATSRNYEPAKTGSYAVVVTDGSCSDTSSCYRVEVSSGIMQITADGAIAMYPNPTRDQFTLSSDLQMERITVMNMLGSVVYQAAPANAVHSVPVSGWSAGVYLVRVHTAQGIANGRIEVIR